MADESLKPEDSLLTTQQVATRLDISKRRVQAMITAGQLSAQKLGRDYVIKESDLALVTKRKAGRPKKAKATENEKAVEKGKSKTKPKPDA